MQKKIFNRIGIYIVFVGVLLTLVSGCSRQTKHKILTFFFTGVPPLGEEKKPVKEIDTSEVKKKMAEKVVLYSHTPWASGKCDQCHKGALGGFGLLGQKKEQKVFHKGGGMPGELILPKKELCIKCHEAMSKSKAYSQGLYLHPVTAEGECNACHDPHQSKNMNILLEKPKKICISCHLEEDVIDPADVCKPDDCLSCHNPHMGKDRLLLTKDYKEVPQKVTVYQGFPSKNPTGQAGVGGQPPAQRASGLEGDQKSKVGSQGPEVRDQKSEVKEQGTGIGDQGSGDKAIQ